MGTKRITNETGGPADPVEAKRLLRTRHLQTHPTVAPGMELLDVLLSAHPEAQLPPSDDGEPGGTDWQRLAWALAMDFVPAFQPGKAQGRPPARKDGLVEAVERLIRSGEARTVTHACSIIDRRRMFPEITSARTAYYRRRKLSR
ncbi:MAG: hypothetical protein JNJ71_10825 [Rubrivivax sp.]|nr:hypothetical protein [Rubrivivax sp.]